MSLVERIARAIVKRNFPGLADTDIDEMWDGWIGDAQAALSAMTELTPGMIAAAWDVIDKAKLEGGLKRLGPGVGAREIWSAMIAKAVEEGGD